jgi:hypothetical protein
MPFSDPYTLDGGADADGGILAVGSLRLFDVRNPAEPQDLGHWVGPPSQSAGTLLSNGYLFMQDSWADMRAFDLSRPEAPRDAGYVELPGEVRDLVSMGSHVYVAVDHGIAVVQLEEPADSCAR